MSTITRQIIHTDAAPKALGPYSQAVLINDSTLYISGALGIDPAVGNLVDGGVEAEARQALINIGHILSAANASYNNVVKTTILLADMNDFVAMNEVYKEFFKTNYPARAAYQVGALPKAARIEIEAIAAIGTIVDH